MTIYSHFCIHGGYKVEVSKEAPECDDCGSYYTKRK